MPNALAPRLGHMVIYRTDGRNGLTYDLPAIVTCIKESHPGDYANGDINPVPVPEDDFHVHLNVLSPGPAGMYVEFNVPQAEDKYQPKPRTWRWLG